MLHQTLIHMKKPQQECKWKNTQGTRKRQTYLIFRQHCRRKRLTKIGLGKPIWLTIPIYAQPATEGPNKSISLSRCKSELAIMCIHITTLCQKPLFLPLQNYHITIIYLVGCPMLMPAGHQLCQQAENPI